MWFWWFRIPFLRNISNLIFQLGGNSNCGNTALRFFTNASITSDILGISRELLTLTWDLLVMVNTVHSFPSIAEFQAKATRAHR